MCVHGNAVWRAKLPGLTSWFAPGHQPVAIFIHLGDARIDVTVADVVVPGSVPFNDGYLAKHAIHGWQRRFHVLQRLVAFVSTFLLPAAHKRTSAFVISFA